MFYLEGICLYFSNNNVFFLIFCCRFLSKRLHVQFLTLYWFIAGVTVFLTGTNEKGKGVILLGVHSYRKAVDMLKPATAFRLFRGLGWWRPSTNWAAETEWMKLNQTDCKLSLTWDFVQLIHELVLQLGKGFVLLFCARASHVSGVGAGRGGGGSGGRRRRRCQGFPSTLTHCSDAGQPGRCWTKCRKRE